MIGNDVSVGYVETHFYHSQFAIWQIMVQSCAKVGVFNIFYLLTLQSPPLTFPFFSFYCILVADPRVARGFFFFYDRVII